MDNVTQTQQGSVTTHQPSPKRLHLLNTGNRTFSLFSLKANSIVSIKETSQFLTPKRKETSHQTNFSNFHRLGFVGSC